MAARVLHVEGFEGKVVAIDMATDEVVASADTFALLTAEIDDRGLRNTMILRVPGPDEPLRVGLG
jgi:hypothetical protein